MKLVKSIAIAALATLGASSAALAGPREDSEELFNLISQKMQILVPAINQAASADTADNLEQNVFAPVKSASLAWGEAMIRYRSDSGYNHYMDFRPCESAANLLTYLSAELISFHRGVEAPVTIRLRHAKPLEEAINNCAALLAD